MKTRPGAGDTARSTASASVRAPRWTWPCGACRASSHRHHECVGTTPDILAELDFANDGERRLLLAWCWSRSRRVSLRCRIGVVELVVHRPRSLLLVVLSRKLDGEVDKMMTGDHTNQ